MANIRSFDTPALGLTPTETGIDATVQGARRSASLLSQAGEDIGRAGSEIGSGIKVAGDIAVKQIEHEEVTRGAANFAQMSADLTQKWNDTVKNADPNNPAVAAKFREEVLNPTLEKYTGTFDTEGGQRFADSHVAALRNHMFEKTSADMSTLAGIAVRKNINDSTTAMSNTAISDPSSVPFLLKSADSQIEAVVGSSPTLSAVDAARAKGELSDTTKKAIVQYGAIGAIQKSGNPEATADEWIKKYPEYISGAEAKTLASNARQQIRSQNYDYELNRRRQKEVAQDRSNEATAKYLVDVRSQDPKLANDPTAKTILNDPTLTKTDKNNLLNYIDRQLKPETDSRLSQGTFVNLLRDLRAPDADPDKVMQKAWDARLTDPGKPGSMSEKDFNQFRAEVVARKTPEGAALEHDRGQFFKQYAGAISGTGGYDPQQGNPKLYAAEMAARRVEGDLRKRGLDPHLVYDPTSEYFFGKPANLMKYAGSMQNDLRDRVEAAASTMPSSTAAAPQKAETNSVPQNLMGIASLSFSKTRNLYRDDTSGKFYRPDGTEVK